MESPDNNMFLVVVVVYPLHPCTMADFPAILEIINAVSQGGQQGCHANWISSHVQRRQSCVEQVLCVYVLKRGQYGEVCVCVGVCGC